MGFFRSLRQKADLQKLQAEIDARGNGYDLALVEKGLWPAYTILQYHSYFFCDFNNPGLRNPTCLTNQMEWQRVFNIVHVEVEVRRSRWVIKLIKCGSGTSHVFFSVEVLQLSHHAISWVPGIQNNATMAFSLVPGFPPRSAVDQKKLYIEPGPADGPHCTTKIHSVTKILEMMGTIGNPLGADHPQQRPAVRMIPIPSYIPLGRQNDE